MRAIARSSSAFVIFGLLNVFGQEPTASRADGGVARLDVRAPTRLRGGLIYEARMTIFARERMADATLSLDRGWTEGMSINTIEPAPAEEASEGEHLVLRLGPIEAGRTFVLWMQFQVNPTSPGVRPQGVALRDGERSIAVVGRNVRVFP